MRWKILVLGTSTSIIAMILILLILIVSGTLVSNATVSASRFVAKAKLEVYSNSLCTQKITSINWGKIAPESSISKTVYVKNLGTTPLMLTMSKTNWNPTTANDSITLTWNRESTILAPNQIISANFTLGVSSSISGITSFSMNIIITGIG